MAKHRTVAAALADKAIYRLVRAADWPPSMHAATDRYERAMHAAANASGADEFNALLAEQKAAEEAYGAECLAIDKARRPDFYADAANQLPS